MSIDHFNWIAPLYDKIFKPRFDETWMRLLALPAQGRLLDVGGGTGRLSQFFNGTIDQVLILDESFQMLYQARRKDSVIPMQGHSERLPFADDSLDRLVMVDALHHVGDQSQTVREMVRILKPGGRMMIEEPDIHWLGVKMIALMEKILGMRSHFLQGEEIEDLFRGLPVKVCLERKKGIIWVMGDKL